MRNRHASWIRIVKKQIRELEHTRLQSLAQEAAKGPNVMVLVLARVIGIGVETADMLVQELASWLGSLRPT
jgi:transposase